jgi:nucleoside-diphosphate-sugar epimerase
MVKSILITGAAGYIGAMLADQFSRSPDLQKIVAIDLKPCPELLRGNDKIIWISAELSGSSWQREAARHNPEVFIHCAWQLKELYGRRELQRKLNIEGTRNAFTFAFREPSVKKIIYFSTIAVYGAHPENRLDQPFDETAAMRAQDYLYATEKMEAEEMLVKFWEDAHGRKQVFVVRPATVTGPRERHMSGKKGLLHMLRNVMPFVPVASKSWCRQYVHEDDLTDIVALLTFNEISDGKGYEVFIASPNDYILGRDFAKIFGKMAVSVPPICVRAAFFAAWHLSGGKIPTGAGGWRYFSYPIFVRGNKITDFYGFEYAYTSKEALDASEGRYSYAIQKIQK